MQRANDLYTVLDLSIGDYTGEEVRRICEEAIARGQAFERAKKEARRRWLKRILCAAALLVAGSAVALSLSIVR